MKQFLNGVLVLACLGFGQFALADGEVEAKYRASVMKSIGGHMSSMATILKNQVHMEDLLVWQILRRKYFLKAVILRNRKRYLPSGKTRWSSARRWTGL